jgi:hypothetical protein
MDLANRDLVEAHPHAVWLSVVSMPAGQSMAERLLDLDQSDYPLRADAAAQLDLSPGRQKEVVEAFRAAIAATPSITSAEWYTDQWLERTVAEAPRRFNGALDRWRELYRCGRPAARRGAPCHRPSAPGPQGTPSRRAAGARSEAGAGAAPE